MSAKGFKNVVALMGVALSNEQIDILKRLKVPVVLMLDNDNAGLEAYPLFLKSAEADIVGGGKQWAGLVYIGGTHPAAAGGAYMVLLYGFLGLRFEDGKPTLHPRLPAGWKKVQLQVHWQGKDWLLTAEEGQQA